MFPEVQYVPDKVYMRKVTGKCVFSFAVSSIITMLMFQLSYSMIFSTTTEKLLLLAKGNSFLREVVELELVFMYILFVLPVIVVLITVLISFITIANFLYIATILLGKLHPSIGSMRDTLVKDIHFLTLIKVVGLGETKYLEFKTEGSYSDREEHYNIFKRGDVLPIRVLDGEKEKLVVVSIVDVRTIEKASTAYYPKLVMLNKTWSVSISLE